jgi:hypothetical protein
MIFVQAAGIFIIRIEGGSYLQIHGKKRISLFYACTYGFFL